MRSTWKSRSIQVSHLGTPDNSEQRNMCLSLLGPHLYPERPPCSPPQKSHSTNPLSPVTEAEPSARSGPFPNTRELTRGEPLARYPGGRSFRWGSGLRLPLPSQSILHPSHGSEGAGTPGTPCIITVAECRGHPIRESHSSRSQPRKDLGGFAHRKILPV